MRIEQFSDEHGIYFRASEEAFLVTKEEAASIRKYIDELRDLVLDMLHWMPCQLPCQRCERYRYPEGCEFEIRRRKLGVGA